MLLPLTLALWLTATPTPDLIDIRQVGSDHLVLASGGLVYRWTGRGALQLETELGTPMAALHACDRRLGVAVGPGGRVRVSRSGGLGWRPAVLQGARDLWAVDSAGCARVLAVGEEGALWEGSLEGSEPRLTRLPSPTRLPLYAVAAERTRAVAVGAGGVVLVRRAEGGPFEALASGTEAPLLAVALVGGERFVVGGAGGLWLGEGAALRQVVVNDQEVFTRVVFSDRNTGVALGQDVVLTTTDGGETWRSQLLPGALAVVHLSGARFLVVGRGGLWRYLEVTPPASTGGPVRVPKRLLPEEPVKPPAPKPAPAVAQEAPPAPEKPQPPRLEPPPESPSCLLTLRKEHISGEAFVDVKAAAGGIFVASTDGTVRRVEGSEPRVAHRTGEPMLGIAVSEDKQHVTVTGWGVLARSEDGGRTFRTEKAPDDTAFYTAAHVGSTLFLFDALGRGWRSVPGPSAAFQEIPLPRKASFYSTSFVDAGRGYVAGDCGTLLETTDGGATWTALGTPLTRDISGVVAYGDTVFISGSDGVFRSDDRARSFVRVLDSKPSCIRLARKGTEVVVACHQGLHHSPDGRTFSLVPVPKQMGLLAAEFLPSGELGAVGAHEFFIRARPTGGAIVNRSPAVERWLKLAERLQEELRRPAPNAAPKVVSVQPPDAPGKH
jgi:photosystem II stability/assembly factor-like uncharacterized protein